MYCLDKCGRHGIVLNWDKFIFAQNVVKFAGFSIIKDSVKPADKYMTTTRDFSTSLNLTHVCDWFGLINQVAYAFTVAEVMSLFLDLLKCKLKFPLNKNVEEIFQQSKKTIVNQIEHGIRIFYKTRPTYLATD